MKSCYTCTSPTDFNTIPDPCIGCVRNGGTENNYKPVRLEVTGHEMSSERSGE